MRTAEVWAYTFLHLFSQQWLKCCWKSCFHVLLIENSLLRKHFCKISPVQFLRISHLDTVKRLRYASWFFFFFFRLNFCKFCELLVVAHNSHVSATHAVFAGDKSISFCLQIFVMLSVQWSVNGYCTFIFCSGNFLFYGICSLVKYLFHKFGWLLVTCLTPS